MFSKHIYRHGGQEFTGLVADGSSGQRAPGVLVCHEAAGRETRAKRAAERLGELGLVALAMDMYGEQFPASEATDRHNALMAEPGLMAGRARAALDALAEHPSVDASNLAVVGFCQGGVVATELARQQAPIKAAVGFHPAFLRPAGSIDAPIAARVLMMVGDADPIVPDEDRKRFIDEMNRADADWQLHILGRVGHSYTNRAVDALGLPGFGYNAVAERRAWAMMTDFLGECFGRADLMGPLP